MDGDYALGPYRRGNVSPGKLGKLFVRLKLGLIGFGFRIACCVSRIALGGLALFGFVFWGEAERNIGVTISGIGGYIGFGLEGIGFVLQKKDDL